MKKFATLSLLMSCMGILGAQTVTAYNYTNCACTVSSNNPDSGLQNCQKNGTPRAYYFGSEDKDGNFQAAGQAAPSIGSQAKIPMGHDNEGDTGIVLSFTQTANMNTDSFSDAAMLSQPQAVITIIDAENTSLSAPVSFPLSMLNKGSCQINTPSALASVRMGKNTK